VTFPISCFNAALRRRSRGIGTAPLHIAVSYFRA